jgi:Na+/H+-dicarboxylate symporter
MVLGAVTGLVAPEVGTSLEVLGDTFVSLLTMLLGPIIFCMVVALVSWVGPGGSPSSTGGSGCPQRRLRCERASLETEAHARPRLEGRP